MEDENEFPDLGLNDDVSNDIDEIIAADRAARKEENKSFEQATRRKMLKIGFFVLAALVAIAILVVGIFFVKPFGSDQKVGDSNKNGGAVQTDETNSATPKNNSEKEFWEEEEDLRYPVKVDEWEKKPYEPKDLTGFTFDQLLNDKNSNKGTIKDSALRGNIINTYSATEVSSNAGRLPSEESGYTSDDSKIELSDGTLNPRYSYWTSEEYKSTVGLYMSRLLNPDFGKWQSFQYANSNANKNFRAEFFTDMFTSSYLKENSKKPYSAWIPVYADWNSNDYGLKTQLLETGPRWYGTITKTTSNFKYNKTTKQYTVDVVVNIKYVSWAKDQSKIVRNGVMKLELVPNLGNNKTSSPYKVLINKASLKVG